MMYMRIVRVQPPEGQADELARRWHRAGEPGGIAETYSEWPFRPHPPAISVPRHDLDHEGCHHVSSLAPPMVQAL
jgi:hypothetical protein